MQSGQYFYDKLPHHVQEKFAANCTTEEIFLFSLECEWEDLFDYVEGAFQWSRTPQGYEYWEIIAKANIP